METPQPAGIVARRPIGAGLDVPPDPRILDHVDAPIYTCDAQGRITYFNEAAAALWGRRPELLKEFWCGSARMYALDGEPLPLDRCPMAIALKEDRTVRGTEILIESPGGARRRILPHPEPLHDDAGRLVGAINTLVDVTDLRSKESELSETRERFARFMAHLPGLAWIKDAQGRYVYANEAAAEMFGFALEDLCGRTDDTLLPAATAVLFKHNDRLALRVAGGVQTLEKISLHGGRPRHLLISKFPIENPAGGMPLVGGIAIDVTQQVRAQAEVKELEARNEEFIATLAHELRNPLTPLGIAAQMLHNIRFRDPSGSSIVLTLERQVGNLTRLVDDLLQSSRIAQGRITLRKADTDLQAVVDNAIETARHQMDQARHELQVDLPAAPVRLHVDAMRLAEIIGNLLNNAAKFTPDGGKIALRARLKSGRLVLRVTDNGVGIPPDQLPYVFELYGNRSHGQHRVQVGMGIGLFVAQKLTELHGGTLRAASRGEGCGSELTLMLPCESPSPSPSPSAEPDPGRGAEETSLRIVVADDNRGAADIMAIAMRSMGINVRVAYDGKSAVEAVGSFRPDIVFMDIGMAGMDGHEAARQIRADPANRDVVLIAVSGWGQDEMRERSLQAGFNHHAVKPLGLEKLRELVSQYGGKPH